MLSTIGKIFLELQSVDRGIRECEPIPTIYLSIRNAETGKMVGQMRFNRDPVYSEKNIRMGFNMMNTSFIDPETLEGGSRLEELVVGGLMWLSMDNHYLVSKDVLPYMVVHDYAEDNIKANLINAKIRSILSDYGCILDNGMYIFDASSGTPMLSDFLKRKQQR